MAATSQELIQRLGTKADACADAIVAAAATRRGSGAAGRSSLSTDADALLLAAVGCLSEAKVAALPVSNILVCPYGVPMSTSHEHSSAWQMSKQALPASRWGTRII